MLIERVRLVQWANIFWFNLLVSYFSLSFIHLFSAFYLLKFNLFPKLIIKYATTLYEKETSTLMLPSEQENILCCMLLFILCNKVHVFQILVKHNLIP